MVSNEKIAQSDAFAKDWNDADEKGIDVDGLVHTLKPSLEKVNVALHDDLKKHEGISLKALE